MVFVDNMIHREIINGSNVSFIEYIYIYACSEHDSTSSRAITVPRDGENRLKFQISPFLFF